MKPLLIAAGLALALLPIWALESFHLFQLTLAVIMALAVLGLNIVTGYNGQISLGHGAFFAVGAYATAIPMSLLDWSFWATLPVSAIVCGVVGWGVGFPALRLGGLYLALTTFALAVAVPQILKHKAVEAWTGGVQGLFLLKPEAPAWLALSPDQYMYLVALLVAGLCYLLTANLLRGRIGRAMMAVRDNPTAAEAMGMDLASLKTRTFAVSAIITGMAGSLSAAVVEFVAPDSFTFILSISLFVGMVVGGVGSILGSVFGGLFVLFVPNLAEAISRSAPGVIYGAILILFLFILPDGVAGLVRRFTTKKRIIPGRETS
ncbi:branched-chain amino acid ABC transporter permease [Rhodovarius sp.]|jgi:branched-chain amino acid transport system permease protein|uniref:branched-chain amino acid ABC transporter permease n=1 Tax=Rhodovarius sp. TaxID=2972673 RepID=UPI0034A28343